MDWTSSQPAFKDLARDWCVGSIQLKEAMHHDDDDTIELYHAEYEQHLNCYVVLFCP